MKLRLAKWAIVMLMGSWMGRIADVQADPVIATGGDAVHDISIGGLDYRVHVFTNTSGPATLSVSNATEALCIVVGGGGGGGFSGGGGGAGGVIVTSLVLAGGSNYVVTVGGGGAGATAAGSPGSNGWASAFGDVAAAGGGGGGTGSMNGSSGGSGGGAGRSTASYSGGAGMPGLGRSGGNNRDSGVYPAGGGGGNVETGHTPSNDNGGRGGHGTNMVYLLDGLPYGDDNGEGANYFAGGGGGGTRSTATGGDGGRGGGGGGGGGTELLGEPGMANTGGGGGGGGQQNSTWVDHAGGDGGSGIVIVRYPLEPSLFLPANPYALADIQTGSERFTNSNRVGLVGLTAPDGYDEFQIAESGDVADIDPNGWLATGIIPTYTPEFSLPATESNIVLYAWFTNSIHAVPLMRAGAEIFYTTVAPPQPPVRAALLKALWPDSTVAVTVEQFDLGSTGGIADGREMDVYGRELLCANESSCDQTPGDPHIVTLNAPGVYPLLLQVQNEAGNVTLSTVTSLVTVVAYDGTNVWTGASATAPNQWIEDDNWSAGIPVAGQAVAIGDGADISLTNATPVLASLTMSGGILTVTGWESAIRATNVTVSGGTIRPSGPFPIGNESRVLIECVDFHLGDGAEINAEGRGYLALQGPGAGTTARAGASHGGIGSPGAASYTGVRPVYGEIHAPETAGSGGRHGSSSSRHGGGVVRILAAGDVTVDGIMDVRATVADQASRSGGSGGSIFITCTTFRGSGGQLLAAGGPGNREGGVGGGGRIAVHYDPSSQAGLPESFPNVTFNARRGPPGSNNHTTYVDGRNGTLSLPDMLFFESNIIDGRMDGVKVHVPGVTTWTFPSLTMTGGEIAFPEMHPMKVEDDLELSGSAQFTLLSGPTNALATPFGLWLDVGADLTLKDNSQMVFAADLTDGGVPYVSCANMTVGANAVLSASFRGFDFNTGPRPGTSTAQGAAHGGAAGALTAFGSKYAPLVPGSGALATRGAGVVWIGARNTMRVDGVVETNGNDVQHRAFGAPNSSTGAGGGILLNATRFTGSGSLRAHGGDASYDPDGDTRGPGSGGRIAVWTPYGPPHVFYNYSRGRQPFAEIVVDLSHPHSESATVTEWDGFTGTVSARAGRYGLQNAEHGTVVFGKLLAGTMILIR